MRSLVLLWGCLALPGYEAMKGPKEISGFEGDTVSLKCTYETKLRKHRKYWCRQVGLVVSRCSGTIYTRDEQEVGQGRTSIHDRRQELSVTVTMRSLTLQDAGIYWCGIDRLGFDDGFQVKLTVFPGKGDSASQAGVCCPPSPSPSFQPLTATRSLQPKAHAWQTQPPELTSPDLRPTVATAEQEKSGVKVPAFIGATSAPSAGTSRFPGASRNAGSPPHTATSPHAGSSRPAIWLPTTPKDPGLDPGRSSSQPRASIPAVRMLAPALVVLGLLLAAGLIAFGSHILRRWKNACPMTETPQNEKVYLPTSPLGNGWATDAMINLAAPPEPLSSPTLSADPCAEVQYLNQTTEEALCQHAEDLVASPLQIPEEELRFSEFISV
uniref:CMRF35-like molecule 9 isoform X1 n=1 Tax=Jaculus jaculus TaxID=51337 RepID=UPI001E1B4D8D|nr:CMRF35-like molecule 9 isoform X1 [Jaculus jaculus]